MLLRSLAEGRKIGVDVTNNVDAKYWSGSADAFLRCITERDFIGCLIIQESCWNPSPSPAIHASGRWRGSLGGTFARIAAEEETPRRPRHGDSQSGASPRRAALRRQGLPAALEVMTTLRADAGEGLQGWNIAKCATPAV